MKKQILVDMDGVLADFYTQFLKKESEQSGTLIELSTLSGKPESEAFPNFNSIIRSEGFFRTAPLIEGSVEGLNYLNDKYKVLIVSSATEFPNSLKEKLDWLAEFFPFISWKQVVLCGNKDCVRGDIMIDDHPKNLDFFEGDKIIFSQPHNIFIKNDDYIRVNNWNQITDIL
ncbi:5'(3')-deoxyribonucleotidase [Apibacter raozihei]|uniref:5' nucleotidase, NT5C type n=1 Tax=Apibacter raozihei TaxID=2500547 RepID=UPI000FE34B26|nr:5'(3')-deoxyribonucleotidase [Apibacter raozihei]